MTDVLEELRRLAARTSPDLPFVRVTGELLQRAADEIAALRQAEEAGAERLLFENKRSAL